MNTTLIYSDLSSDISAIKENRKINKICISKTIVEVGNALKIFIGSDLDIDSNVYIKSAINDNAFIFIVLVLTTQKQPDSPSIYRERMGKYYQIIFISTQKYPSSEFLQLNLSW